MTTGTAASLAREAQARLAAAGVPSPAADAEVLLAHVLDVPRSDLHAAPGRAIAAAAAARYRRLIERRAAREPLQYLTGTQEFWSLAFEVTPAVLIPRPETEHVIEALLRRNRRPDPWIADIGTGSGCLAVAAAREIPAARVVAVDLSEAALGVARRNAARHGVAERIDFRRGDLLAPLRDILAVAPGGRGLDFVMSNPPYIGDEEAAGLSPEVRDHEPRAALFAGTDPLAVHRRLAAETPAFLQPGGSLIAEIGAGQDRLLAELYAALGAWHDVQFVDDLAGIPRILVARAA